MKLPGRILDVIDGLEDLKSLQKEKLKAYIKGLEDLPEHPAPHEAKKIVSAAVKELFSTDSKVIRQEAPKKKEKPAKKDKVEESQGKKLSFKEFLNEGNFQCSLILKVKPDEMKKTISDMSAAGLPRLEWADGTRLFSDNKAAISAVEKYLKRSQIEYTKEIE